MEVAGQSTVVQADVEAQGVDKHHGAHHAVPDLSFRVDRGSPFSILGPSICSSTTPLRMVAGYIAP